MNSEWYRKQIELATASDEDRMALTMGTPTRAEATAEAIKAMPQLAQRQDSLTDQLRTLIDAANKLGCYDAADFISSRLRS